MKMLKPIPLNNKNLNQIPPDIAKPCYDRGKLTAGIIHIGVGGFHRAHQAYYTDELLNKHGNTEWAICGIGLMGYDKKIQKELDSQDHLYTLLILHPDGKISARIVGSIIEYLYAPENPEAVIEKMAHHNTKIVSLTITEGGYNFSQTSGEFDFGNADIQWDLKNPGKPKTVFGFLTGSLKRRKEKGLSGYTIQSCDNIQHNGDVAKKMLLAFAGYYDIGLSGWIEANVSFPNSMVDRITPASAESARSSLAERFGIIDYSPVTCEPFCQWVIEDNFINGRPSWEKAGAQFVPDVSPYEKMKIRLLNAGHSLLGFLGALCGYSYIHEVVRDPVFLAFLREFMDKEVTPILGNVPGIDLDNYKNSLIERFGNSNIRDHVSRICLQSSAKIPKFLLPTIREQLLAEGPLERSALVIAGWCRYAEGTDEAGRPYQIEDDMRVIIQEKAIASRIDPLSFLTIGPVFGDLLNSQRFTRAYLNALNNLYGKGTKKCMKEIINK